MANANQSDQSLDFSDLKSKINYNIFFLYSESSPSSLKKQYVFSFPDYDSENFSEKLSSILKPFFHSKEWICCHKKIDTQDKEKMALFYNSAIRFVLKYDSVRDKTTLNIGFRLKVPSNVIFGGLITETFDPSRSSRMNQLEKVLSNHYMKTPFLSEDSSIGAFNNYFLDTDIRSSNFTKNKISNTFGLKLKNRLTESIKESTEYVPYFTDSLPEETDFFTTDFRNFLSDKFFPALLNHPLLHK